MSNGTTSNATVFPTVHMNGTSSKSLIEMNRRAYDAVSEAIVQLRQACPHGRDYYTQSPGAVWTALQEHTSRLERLESVKADLEEIILRIMDGPR